MKSILKTLGTGKVLISDGAWGTFLHHLGLAVGDCPEIWNITHRNEVLSIASYSDAGADMILTNNFGLTYKVGALWFAGSGFPTKRSCASISRKQPARIILCSVQSDLQALF
jgi:5-methyltetrahydrofolate--homocysteine methyltransferase